MAEYIEREEAMNIAFKYPFFSDSLMEEIKAIPAADVAPVRHGQWLDFYGDFSTAECSLCAELYEVSPDEHPRKEFLDAFKEFYNFCPSCGAKMDGGEYDGASS